MGFKIPVPAEENGRCVLSPCIHLHDCTFVNLISLQHSPLSESSKDRFEGQEDWETV